MAIWTIGLNPAIDRLIACEHFSPGTTSAAHTRARLAAGKAANVSRALALCGVGSTAAGFIGAAEADWFTRQLWEVKPIGGTAAPSSPLIACNFISVAGPTRENITIVDPSAAQETHLRDDGFTVAERNISTLRDFLRAALQAGDIAIFAGSAGPGISVEQFVALLPGPEMHVVVDTSGPALAASCHLPLWLIKPNLQELSELLGAAVPPEPAEVVRLVRAAALPVQHVLVSMGAAGAVLVAAAGACHAQCRPAAPVVSTVGCGDHLLGGFLAACMQGLSADAALSRAVALAAARAISPEPGAISAETYAVAQAACAVQPV